jgi:O-antigen/teichoic acid export membrane protein
MNRSRRSILKLFAKLGGSGEYTGVGHSYGQILQGILTAVAGRGVAVISGFIAVPLTVRYLGAERYGVWVTLTSILAWFTIFDLGMGSTAINGVAEALARKDFGTAKLRINAAYVGMTGVALALGVCALGAWPFISWPAVLGAKGAVNRTEIDHAAAFALIVFLGSFPFTITPKILGACQKVVLANYWASAGSLLSLLLLVIATRLQWGLPGLVGAFSGSVLLVGALSTAWLYRHFDWLTIALRSIPRDYIRALLRTGLPFFAAQIAGVILFQTDNLIIAQILGAEQVTPYSVTWKLFSYSYLLQVVSIPALWPAYSDAFARRDFVWIRKTYRYNVRFALSSTLALVMILIVIARRFISVWAGPAAVPSRALVFAMGLWSLLAVLSWCEGCLLGAAGRVKGQAIYSGIGALVNIVASILLGKEFGLIGIIGGTLCAYAFCIIIPQTLEVRRILLEK